MKRTIMKVVALLVIAASLPVYGATVAYWRFEAGPAGTNLPHSTVNGVYSLGAPDVSGNGNHLSAWTIDNWGASAFNADVPAAMIPFNGSTNSFSIKNMGSYPGTFTSSADSKPAGIDIEAITPLKWTVEATFKPETGGYRTIVGRDGRYVAPVQDNNLACLYLQLIPGDAVAIKYADVAGVWHEAFSAAAAVQGFAWGTDPQGLTGKWYSAAATNDGKTLKLYLNNLSAGTGYQLVGQTDLTTSGSTNLALARGATNGGDWHTGAWTVGRGLYAGGHGDRAYGFIDEVRVSNSALSPKQFLFAPRVIATEPSPEVDAITVGAASGTNVLVTLGWKTGMNAANLNQTNAAITRHYLYFSTDPNLPGATVAIPAGSPTAATATYQATLLMDKTYYWRVDESVNNSLPADPNNTIVGAVWNFDTIKSIPVIIKDPVNTIVDPGQTAQFTVTVTSVSTAKYQWYKTTDNANNTAADDVAMGTQTTSNTLSLPNAQKTNEGYYYCVVTNAGGASTATPTATAMLAVRRQVAWWTLDQAGFVNGLYQDASGEGHHADPNGAPVFVTGQKDQGIEVARASTGLEVLPTTGSWARAGAWNPSQYSNQFTVNFWLNWAGSNKTWQSFISKRSGDWDNANVYWQISTGDGDRTIRIESPRGAINVNDGLLSITGQWAMITAVWDGTNGYMYINGEQRASGGFQPGDKTNAEFCLGGNSFDVVGGDGGTQFGREWMNGSLDNVKVYNYAVSEMDIARLYAVDEHNKAACVQSIKPSATYDLNNDCIVNIADLAIFAGQWLDCALVPTCLQ